MEILVVFTGSLTAFQGEMFSIMNNYQVIAEP